MNDRILNRLQNNATRRSPEALKRDITRLQRGVNGDAGTDATRWMRELERAMSVDSMPPSLIDMRRISRRRLGPPRF
jgi:hypothetical protein